MILWFLPFVISRIIGLSISLKKYVTSYGVAFIPLVAAAHLSKSLLKTTSRIPYFEHIFSDVTGMRTAGQILENQITLQPNPAWTGWMITGLISVIFILGIVISLKAVRIANKRFFSGSKMANVIYLMPLIYGAIFVITIIFWRWVTV